MERDPRKVSAVLADPTRYAIYQAVVAAPHPVSVQAVAADFSLHPNVARMHLSKLAEIGLLVVEIARSGRGGRPGYLYRASDQTVSLHVPGRDFRLLADLLVQALALLGEGSTQAVYQVGRSFGRRLGQEAVRSLADRSPGPEAALRACATAMQRFGASVSVAADGRGPARLVLKACGFREVAEEYPDHVCRLCKAMVEGLTEVCLAGEPTVAPTASLPNGDAECIYEVNGLIRLE